MTLVARFFHQSSVASPWQVLAVGGGGQEFAFKARPQEHCKLVQLKPGQKDEGVAQCLGDMPFKLYPSRTIPSRPPSVLACAAQPGPAAALPQASDGSEPSFGLYAKAVAAARLSDLRRIIIALLAQHPASLRSLKQKVVSAMQASSSPDPPPSQADLEKCVKSVAFYKAPGVYVLNQGLEAELHSLVATVDTAPQDTPPSGAIKRRKLNSPVDGEEGAHAPDRHCDTPTAPSIGTESDGRMGSDGVQQHQLRRLSCPPSSSSRGSESADERWVLEHCGRCPQTIRITTEQVGWRDGA